MLNLPKHNEVELKIHYVYKKKQSSIYTPKYSIDPYMVNFSWAESNRETICGIS